MYWNSRAWAYPCLCATLPRLGLYLCARVIRDASPLYRNRNATEAELRRAGHCHCLYTLPFILYLVP